MASESQRQDDATARTPRRSGTPTVLRFADWLVPILLGLLGLAAVLSGLALWLAADPNVVAQMVAEGTIQSDVFAEEALAAVTVAMARWSAVGLVVAGLLGWAGAVAFAGYRRRERRGGSEGRAITRALVGAVVSLVVSFVPFSPVLGGLVAGYLHGREGAARVGGLSGLLFVLPVAVLVAFVFGGVAAGAARAGAVGGALLVGGVLAVALVFAVVFTVALAAVGGYLGGRLADETGGESPDRPAAADDPVAE